SVRGLVRRFRIVGNIGAARAAQKACQASSARRSIACMTLTRDLETLQRRFAMSRSAREFWLKTLFRSWFPKRPAPIGRRQFRPALESLEDRMAPAVLTVTDPGDNGGAYQLRAAITTANATTGDTIQFANSLASDTITLTQGELQITSPMTITGLGASQ